MTLYIVDEKKITPIGSTTFEQQGLKERKHLQRLLKSRPDVISPNTLIVAEEFSDWEDSRRSIDLLGIDKNANLVVIELKRTEDGGHMELQAIRYAAMISTMTFDKLVATHDQYLKDNSEEQDARDRLRNFLGWNDPDDEKLGQEIKIVLASAGFSRELTTAVLWLNEQGLDIRCVRMCPYDNNGQVLLDVQTIIPVPGAEEHQTRIRERRQEERVARESARDFSRYDVTIDGQRHSDQNKRNMMLCLIKGVFASSKSPPQVMEHVVETLPSGKLRTFEGMLDAEQIREQLMQEDRGGTVPRFKRFFCDDPFQTGDKTYVLSNQWGRETLDAARKIADMLPDLNIEFKSTDTIGA